MIVVAKIGSSSVTDAGGRVDEGAVTKLCAEVAAVHESGHQVIVVSSGAIAAGQPALGMRDVRRSGARASDLATLQARTPVAAIVPVFQHSHSATRCRYIECPTHQTKASIQGNGNRNEMA